MKKKKYGAKQPSCESSCIYSPLNIHNSIHHFIIHVLFAVNAKLYLANISSACQYDTILAITQLSANTLDRIRLS